MKIFKYQLIIKEEIEIETHSVCSILHVGLDPNGAACIWLLVDDAAPKAKLRLAVFGTGHEVPNRFTARNHVASFVMQIFVWHVWYLGFHTLDGKQLLLRS